MRGRRQETWHKKRHVFFYRFSRFVFRFYAKTRLRFRGEKFDNRSRPYLFLYNHQTPYDQHLLYLCLPRQPYTVATEDILTMGALSRFIHWAQAPVPFKKSMSDAGAVMTCHRIVREGYSIALSPEGSRTYTGETGPIKPSIVKLVKLFRLPVAFFRIRGGYDALPRYADKARRTQGRVTGRIARVLEYEEYKDMTNDELYELVCKEMYSDESDDGVPVKSGRRAEYLERAVYRCPSCGARGRLKSKGNQITCLECGAVGVMDAYKRFQAEFPVRTVKEWMRSQEAWVRSLPVTEGAQPLFCERVKLRRLVRERKKKVVLEKDAEARIYSDRLEIGGRVYPYSHVGAMTVCGRKRLDFYAEGVTYQLTAGKTFCAIKYVNVFYHYRNEKEEGDGFLGI